MEYFSDGTRGDIFLKLWTLSICTPRFPITHYAKKVVVVVCNWPRLDGYRAPHQVDESSQPSLVFPNAFTLKIIFPDNRLCCYHGANLTERGASEFAKELRRMVPAVRNVTISSLYPHRADNRDSPNDHLLDRFCIDVCKNVSQVSVEVPRHVDEYCLRAEWIDGLTCIEHMYSQRDHRPVFELIWRNADTLQSLDLCLQGDQRLSDICRDNSGCAIVYPVLDEFVIRDYRDSHSSIFSDCDQPVPFPSLCILRTTFVQRCDNYMFRGNNSSLKYLSIKLCADIMAGFEQCNTFTKNKFPQLCNLELQNSTKYRATPISASDAALFAIKVLHAAQFVRTLVLFGDFDKHVFCTSVQSAEWASRIRSLTLTDKMSFTDLVHFLRNLPALHTLYCNIEISTLYGDDYEDYADYFDKPVDVIYKYIYPLGRSFTRWYITNKDDDYNLYMKSTVALVAILCPNFTHAFVYEDVLDYLKVDAKWPIVCEQFEQHRERLEQIVVLENDCVVYF